ncbi:MAG: alpha/beta hydrolase [Proteobacteria bacterium]|nr:alpha/beta hydrolase [Pseudomonadota bacterium]
MRARLGLLVLCLTFTAARAAPPGDAIALDPPPQAPAPKMLEMSIPSHGSRLFGVFYQAGGEGAHPTLVMLHGFAGYEQNEDLAQAARRAGFNVLLFHYRGAWGSEGAYSLAHCIEDTQAVLAYLRGRAQLLAVDTSRLVLAGHSVGGHVAGIVASRDPSVAGVAMISAANRRLAMMRPGWADETRARFEGELGPLRGATAAGLITELRSHAGEWDLVHLAPHWAPRPVLVVTSDDRFRDEDDAIAEAVRTAGGSHLTAVHLDTDHAYSGGRLALTRTVLDWLAQFSADP